MGDFGAHGSMKYHYELGLSYPLLHLYISKIASFLASSVIDLKPHAREIEREGGREREELLIWCVDEEFPIDI